jgi:hypothetical protein
VNLSVRTGGDPDECFAKGTPDEEETAWARLLSPLLVAVPCLLSVGGVGAVKCASERGFLWVHQRCADRKGVADEPAPRTVGWRRATSIAYSDICSGNDMFHWVCISAMSPDDLLEMKFERGPLGSKGRQFLS